MSISQLVLVSRETRTVLTASFLKTPKLRKWSIEQGNLWEKAAQMHSVEKFFLNKYLKNIEFLKGENYVGKQKTSKNWTTFKNRTNFFFLKNM